MIKTINVRFKDIAAHCTDPRSSYVQVVLGLVYVVLLAAAVLATIMLVFAIQVRARLADPVISRDKATC